MVAVKPSNISNFTLQKCHILGFYILYSMTFFVTSGSFEQLRDNQGHFWKAVGCDFVLLQMQVD